MISEGWCRADGVVLQKKTKVVGGKVEIKLEKLSFPYLNRTRLSGGNINLRLSCSACAGTDIPNERTDRWQEMVNERGLR